MLGYGFSEASSENFRWEWRNRGESVNPTSFDSSVKTCYSEFGVLDFGIQDLDVI